MSNVLPTLLRLRAHSRREAELQRRDAERERDNQRARLDELHAGVARARDAVDGGDAEAIVAYQAFRLREELRDRRETARLNQRERDVDTRTTQHLRCVRDELTLGVILDLQAERRAQEDRRVDTRRMDEIANGLRKAE
jgi:hypothetical protein